MVALERRRDRRAASARTSRTPFTHFEAPFVAIIARAPGATLAVALALGVAAVVGGGRYLAKGAMEYDMRHLQSGHVGNEELYRRMLVGFLDAKADFPEVVRTSLASGAPAVAIRRTHDLKGLAGTIGAQPLEAAAQVLHRLLVNGDLAAAAAQFDIVIDELARVSRRIDETLAAAR